MAAVFLRHFAEFGGLYSGYKTTFMVSLSINKISFMGFLFGNIKQHLWVLFLEIKQYLSFWKENNIYGFSY